MSSKQAREVIDLPYYIQSQDPYGLDPKYFWRADQDIDDRWFFMQENPWHFYDKWLTTYEHKSVQPVSDFTHYLQDFGRTQSLTVIRILLYGSVISVPNGYVFIDGEAPVTYLAFLSSCDSRYKDIKAVRKAMVLKKAGSTDIVIDNTLAADFDPKNVGQMLYHMNMELII